MLKRLYGPALWLLTLGSALVPSNAAETNGPTSASVLAASTPGDWRPLDPENTLYLELAAGRVVIELAPKFAPQHVANVKALARERYFDGLAILRCQDNYVVQWGDPDGEKPEVARPIRQGKRTLAPEFDRAMDETVPFTRLPDPDVYAPETGFSEGFPVARDSKSGRMWLVHTYGMVGAGRDNAPDSGGGTELYVVIGHAPRQLDRNVTLLGRVIQGMELLSALPRGPAPMGFYTNAEQRIPLKTVRLAADVPPAERTALEVLRTESPAFPTLVEARRNRREEWFLAPVGRIDIGNVPVPARATLTAGSNGPRGPEWKLPDHAPLLTRWAREVSPTNALPEYPRPQLARQEWQNLNGLWDYAITGKGDEKAPAVYAGKILVPFPMESALSGVMKSLLPKDRLWYHRTFPLPAAWRGRRILLHFGAVDWETTVYFNGRELGGHRGGYDAFTLDLTQAIKPGETQDLMVSVLDPTDTTWHLHGKQSLHPGGCSYTAASGIWQTVWIEPVPLTTSIESLLAVPDLARGVLKLTITGRVGNEPVVIRARAADGAREVAVARGPASHELSPTLRENKVRFYKNTGSWFVSNLELSIPEARRWTPEDPFLYDLTVSLADQAGVVLDTVKSYFGMRSVGKQTDPKGFTRFLLNGQPTLMAGALDQGFWPDGVYTAPTDEALKYDVQIARQAGLNIIRKHVKVEPDRFYYWCDQLGLLVLQDLPTGHEGDPKTDLPLSPEAAAQCELEKRTLIQQRWNHPAIIAWCPFNEGWGQHDTLRYARWIKELDPSRLVDEASGFPWHGGGDIQDNHGGVSAPNPQQVGLVSENGGYGLATPGHDWPGQVWSYRSYDAATDGTLDAMAKGLKGDKLPRLDAKSRAWFTREVARLYAQLWAQKDTGGMTGQFFCQLYDTESECDGLVSYDRAVWKVDPRIVSQAARGQGRPSK